MISDHKLPCGIKLQRKSHSKFPEPKENNIDKNDRTMKEKLEEINTIMLRPTCENSFESPIKMENDPLGLIKPEIL